MTSFRRYLALAILLATSLLFAACDSGESGGGTAGASTGNGGGGGGAGTGNVVFQFTRSQSADLPLATGLVSFTFYNAPVPINGDVVLMTQAAFAPTITIQDVPEVAQSVVIKALDNNTNPLFELSTGITVTAMATTEIDLSSVVGAAVNFTGLTIGPAPLNLDPAQTEPVQLTLTGRFSNDSTVAFNSDTFANAATFTSNSNSISISDVGLVTINSNGGAGTITANYTINEVTQTGTLPFSFSSLQATPANFGVNAGQVSGQVTVTLFDGGNAPQAVTENLNTTYTISPAVAGITANTNGTVTVTNGVQSGTTANLFITHTSNNRVFTDTIVLTVN